MRLTWKYLGPPFPHCSRLRGQFCPMRSSWVFWGGSGSGLDSGKAKQDSHWVNAAHSLLLPDAAWVWCLREALCGLLDKTCVRWLKRYCRKPESVTPLPGQNAPKSSFCLWISPLLSIGKCRGQGEAALESPICTDPTCRAQKCTCSCGEQQPARQWLCLRSSTVLKRTEK